MGIVSRATDVAEIAAKHADHMEAGRRLHSEAVQAVVAAGFARHFVPSRHGGDDGDFTSFLAAVTIVGRSCPSTAWFASLTAGLGRMAAYLPGPGRRELWSDGPDPVIVGALMPLGAAEPVDGGWTLHGRWPYVSGIEYSEWALVCGMAVRVDGPPQARFFLVPRATYGIVDTWFNVGMRATGSNTLVLDEVFVPASHTFTRDELTAGRPDDDADAAVCHRAPLRAINGMSFAAPILGAAQGALQSWTRLIADKKQHTVEHQQVNLARSAGEIDAAELLLARSAAVADRGEVSHDETIRAWRDSTLAAELLVTAVGRLMTSAGTSAQVDTHPLQRYWRDVNAAASHIVLRPEGAAAAYAEGVLKPGAGNP
jgi:two-component flavin-dependent monooxygenase